MSLWTRILALLRIKTARTLDRLEDPAEMLDASYDRQLELMRGVRRGIVDVAAAKKRIEMQVQEIAARYQGLEQKAREALTQGREDLAREALTRRAALEAQAQGLRDQHTSLEAQEQKLVTSQQSLAARIEAFRVEKETMKATYSASSARVRVNEALAGIGSEMSEVGETLARTRDRIDQLNARATATDELLDRGVLAAPGGAPDADLDRALGTTSLSADVERKLAALRADLGLKPGDTPPR
ncbi:MAG TPA: PspA/IM30 family protein [Candidatus Limnocylindria bacterium]|nr:PspA/IM30 family protein [Candidatus Limnocylindria bacterium]